MARLTRKELVLALLERNKGQWVDGPELCDPYVGGSEGLRRVRELKADGYPIVMRRHPNRNRAVRQYQLVIPKGGSLVTPERPKRIPPPGYRWSRKTDGSYRLWHERQGPLNAFVQPGMSGEKWYWSVAKGNQPAVGGSTDSLDSAMEWAIDAYMRGTDAGGSE